jgi:hypothetical protein
VKTGKRIIVQVSGITVFEWIHQQVVEPGHVILFIARAIIPIIPPNRLSAVS